MLSDSVSLKVPAVAGVMDKLDAMKAKFLAVPANVRAALDKLSRIRRLINQTNMPVPPREINEAAQVVENNLKRVQLEWNTSAERFTMLDNLRREQKAITMDGLTIASQLLTSAGYVMKNADKNIAAVDALANKYLTAEQRAQLGTLTTGSGGMSVPTLALLGVGAFLLLRR